MIKRQGKIIEEKENELLPSKLIDVKPEINKARVSRKVVDDEMGYVTKSEVEITNNEMVVPEIGEVVDSTEPRAVLHIKDDSFGLIHSRLKCAAAFFGLFLIVVMVVLCLM